MKASMQIHRSFLIATVVLLLSLSEEGLTMKDDSSDPPSKSVTRKSTKASKKVVSLPSRASSPIELPVDIQAYILSFLNQWDLLKAGGTSKRWRQAAERIWKNKPLDLSNRHLSPGDYKALAYGPFSSLILTSVHLGYEGACILALSSRFKQLDLSSNGMGEEGAKALASGNLSALTMLSLCGNCHRNGRKRSSRKKHTS